MNHSEDIFQRINTHPDDLEKERLVHLAELNNRKKLAVPVGIILILAFVFILSSNKPISIMDLFMIFVVCVGVVFTWIDIPNREYMKAYKKEILPGAAHHFYGLEYNSKISMSSFQPSLIKSGILPIYQKMLIEDGFSGDYKGVSIQFAKLILRYSRSETFKGVVIKISFKSNFDGHTVLLEQSSEGREKSVEKNKNLKRANLVDPIFEQKFTVYTNNQVEARYLIDPLIIEKFNKICLYFRGSNVRASYFDSDLILLIKSDHNFFEDVDVHTPSMNTYSLNVLKNEMEQILFIIDYLELGTKVVKN